MNKNFTFKVIEFSGIPLYIHWSWFIIPLFIVPNWMALASLVIVFFFVIMHEYGHCLMAQRLGIPARDITLYPIGGIAAINFVPDTSPTKELLIVWAGPLVNLFFVLVSIPFILLPVPLEIMIAALMIGIINFILFAFNILPIFPMDGGKILRALLCYKFSHYDATYWVVRYSQIICVVLIFTCIYYSNYLTALIFGFLIFAAQMELAVAKVKSSFDNIRYRLSITLSKPELAHAGLAELILVLRGVEDENLRQIISADDLIVLFEEMQEGLQSEK